MASIRVKTTKMNRLSREKQIEVVKCLIEGLSIRGTVRLTGVSKPTVLKLLVDIGEACEFFHNDRVRNLTSKRIQCDELWAFVAKKDRACTPEERSMVGVGSVWTWTAIDADTKLCVSYLVGGRDGKFAYHFMRDVAARVSNRIQLTTDAHSVYFQAVRESFGIDIDYAMLIKKYGPAPAGPDTRYSPPECIGIKKKPIMGNPDPDHISTSYVERQNLSMRMGMRRFTRLTNGFSKKMENLMAAVALYFIHYNFVRVHETLGTTPAIAAGIEKREWTIGDIVDLLND
jgi:IS1 family transposase